MVDGRRRGVGGEENFVQNTCACCCVSRILYLYNSEEKKEEEEDDDGQQQQRQRQHPLARRDVYSEAFDTATAARSSSSSYTPHFISISYSIRLSLLLCLYCYTPPQHVYTAHT